MLKKITFLLLIFTGICCGYAFSGTFYIPEGSVLRQAADDALQNYSGEKVTLRDARGVQYRAFLFSWSGNCRTGKIFSQNGDMAKVSLCKQKNTYTQQMASVQRTPVQKVQYQQMAVPTRSRDSYGGRFSERPGLQYDLRGNPNAPFMNVDPLNTNLNDIYGMSPEQFAEYQKRVNWVNDHVVPQTASNDRDYAENAQVWMGDVNRDRYQNPQDSISDWIDVAENLKDLFD